MALLTPEEKKRIREAVEETEKTTSGEIVTAIIPESDDYAARELLFGIVCGLVTYILLVIFSDSFAQILDNLLWIDSPALIPLSMMAVTLMVGALAYALAQIPAIDRLIIGRRMMTEAVRRRAMRHFVESAAYDTMDRTGVLLFISVLERRVELITDKGINEKVESSAWRHIVDALVTGIKEKQTSVAIEMAIKSIGKILSEHAPPRPDDINEISNGPMELGKGS